MPAGPLFDHEGRPVPLGARLGAGGEGAVFEIAGDAARVAKIYHRPPDEEKATKLRLMADMGAAAPELLDFAAWPGATLARSPGGPVVGFVMPRRSGAKEIHHLYGPAHRRVDFPQADYSFLVHAARNCAAALEALHERRIVVGDVNQGNFLVSRQATVGLIDCDSFQVEAGGRLFRCPVGVGHFTPPELQGVRFADVDRTADHDAFGLAVLTFHLLFLGRHPFAGRWLGDGRGAGHGHLTLERAIHEHRFAYGPSAAAARMAPPPHALPFESVPAEIRTLFERAFLRGSEAPGARPRPAQWRMVLDAFRQTLGSCFIETAHKVPAHVELCPWCEIVERGGPDLFVYVLDWSAGPAARPAPFDRSAVWARIAAVGPPRTTYLRPASGGAGAPPGTRPGALRRLARRARTPAGDPAGEPAKLLAAVVGALALFIFAFAGGAAPLACLCLAVLPIAVAAGAIGLIQSAGATLATGRVARAAGVAEALARLSHAEADWERTARRHREQFAQRRQRLEEVSARHADLEWRLEQERRRLAGADGAALRDFFLKRVILDDEDIPGVGPGLKSALQGYGIETAYDLTRERFAEVPALRGGAVATRLLAFRESATRRFDPRVARAELDAELRELHARHARQAKPIEAELEAGAAALSELVRKAEADLDGLLENIERLVKEVERAKEVAAP